MRIALACSELPPPTVGSVSVPLFAAASWIVPPLSVSEPVLT